MKECLIRSLFLFVCLLAFPASYSDAAGDPKARALYGVSPHTENGDCALCHVAPKEKLQGWFVFGSTKRQLISDPNTLCRKCHGVSFGHGVGKKPAMNRADLPLDADGTITCALTCHNMHISGLDDPNQQRLHLRLPQLKLCASCHDN